METPQTAAQINLPQTGQVAAPSFPPKVTITPKPKNVAAEGWTGGTIKGTRESVLKQVAASGLSDAKQAALAEDVDGVAPEFELIRVDFHRHPHLHGWNTAWTVAELL